MKRKNVNLKHANLVIEVSLQLCQKAVVHNFTVKLYINFKFFLFLYINLFIFITIN